MKTVHWFRQDLRLSDNPGLLAAARAGSVIPLFILDETDRQIGGASKWWLHHSLDRLSQALGAMVIMRGDPKSLIPALMRETGAQAITWNRVYEPHAVNRDGAIKKALKNDGYEVHSFPGSVIYEPWEVQTGSGGPYKVYTPFWRAVQQKGFPAPAPFVQPELTADLPASLSVDGLGLLPGKPNWAVGWEQLWEPGEAGAHQQFEHFIKTGLDGYGELRNRPDLPKVSRLSPHIHFGEISPRQLMAKTQLVADETPTLSSDVIKFQSEIAWRDFANHLLFHFPQIPTENWKKPFDNYPWREDAEALSIWQTGMTGYPMVDAAMRELWHTGYMHNRMRMLAASFLIKHLRIHWREGEAWFWDTLLDADLANNTTSWQWVCGSGADAAPYFRIFNPFTQGAKFDPQGDYVRKWCPELAAVPTKYIHAPHEAPQEVLQASGVVLGKTYPYPMVDHKKARAAALAGYETIKSA